MRSLLLLIFLAVSVNIGNANEKCSRYCKEHSTHKFQTGIEYTYKYQGDLKTLLNATVNNSVGFSFDSVITITVLSPCDLVLKVVSVSSSESQQFQTDFKKNPLYFSFQSGRINTICPTDNEPIDILNLKKAILSVFQTGASNTKEDSLIYETDISGNCETHYRVLARNPLIIEKSKNLEACSHRMNQHLSWNSVPYIGKSKKKSPPLLKSTQICKQAFTDSGILHSSECNERHGFQPLSHRNSGAVTYAVQKMQLISENIIDEVQDNSNIPIRRRTSLLFETKPETIEKVDVATILNLLENLKQKTTNGTEDDTPRLFSHLVYYLRNIDYEKLVQISNTIKKSVAKLKILLDAISLVSTPNGIKIMLKLYEEGEINEYQINSWITSLAFTKNPSIEVLNEMKPLMTMSSSINQKAVLSLSSLVNRFCQKNPDCIRISEIKEIMVLLEAPIASNCAAFDPKAKAEILLALKGIGNAGITTSLSILQACYANEDLPVEIRLAAFAAHRRFSCVDNKNSDDFLNYFANTNENTEIRIAAYLSSMECASLSTYTQVKDVLYKEETNQVGSFVWTHLTNLQETSSRWKQSLRLLTENHFLRNKFNTDIRKYSRNYEISSFFDSINIGGSMESNIIFSEESYLPRSAMFNLTVDIFGETVNVFEINTRAEGLEDVVEKFFAPDGYFPDRSISSVLKTARSEQEKIDNIQKIGNTFRSEKRLFGEPNILLSLKAFGNEFSYFDLNDLINSFGEPTRNRNLIDILTKDFTKQNLETTKSFVFVDSSIKVPTLLGLPLELSVNGTASLGLTAHTKLDIKDLRNMKIAVEGKIYPSAVIEVIGAITVDSGYHKVGLNLVGKMSSNSYIDGHAFIDGGKIVDIKLNVPKNQFNLFNIQSKLFKIKNNRVFEIRNTTDNVNTVNLCTPKNINSIIGFEVCSKLSYVNASDVEESPYFPLTGSFEYNLGLKKIDTFGSYVFNMKSENKNGRSISIFFDTPASKVKRTIIAKYQLDWDNLLINAQFLCPFAKLELNSNLSNKTNRNIYIQAQFNNKEFLLFQSSLSSKSHGNLWKIEPSAKLHYKSSPVAAMSGSINFIRGSEYIFDLKLDGFAEDAILLKGALNYIHNKKYEAAASVHSSKISGNFTGSLIKNDEIFSLKLAANYSMRELKKQSLGLVLESKTTEKSRSFQASFESTQMPLYDTLVGLDYKWDDLYFEGNGRVNLFKTSWQMRQLFKFKYNGNYYADFSVLCSLLCVEKDINYTANFEYISQRNQFGVHGLLQLNRRQRLEALMKVNDLFEKSKKFLVLVYYPEYTWTLDGNVKEQTDGAFNAYFSGNYEVENEKTTFLVVRGRYGNSSLQSVQNHTISAIIEFPNTASTPWYLNTMIQYSKETLSCISQLSIDSNAYLSHLVWMESSVSLIVQKNQKRLFFISGGKSGKEYTGTIALNIYQHFELNTRLLMPYQSFLFEFFWNKDVSLDQKISLAFERDNLGRYMTDLQYPNQKILATFVLLPTQVTLNVTWGTHLSRRIYLEAGNKIYDVGGVWFAKLETPFEYLERQELLLHYYVLSDSAKLKTDVKWRNQSINLQMSGKKTERHISGSIDIQTTLAEIRNAIAVLNHYRNDTETKSNAKLVFNEHEIALKSFWKSQGLNIVSNFEMTSPTNSLLPIYASLLTDNNITAKFLNCTLNWQSKLISLDYRFEKPHSHIKIITPFEGIEETQFHYTLVAEVERLVLELKANLLRQENWALLSWTNEKEAVGVKFQVLSPITGNYMAVFKHSTVLGHLSEYLIVTQGKDDILALKLFGHLLPLQVLNLTAEAALLAYTASISIENQQHPTTTTIKAKLNNDFIMCKAIVAYDDDSFSSAYLNITTNILEKEIEFRYKREETKYISQLSLPNGYVFRNILIVEGLGFIEDNFEAATPEGKGLFEYSHRLTDLDFKHEILLKYGEKECRYLFYYNLNEYLNLLVDKINLKVTTPWYHDVLLNFSITAESSPLNIWRPQLYFIYDDENPISLTSSIRYEPFNSYLALKVQISDKSILELEMSYDFTERINKLRFWLQRLNSRYSVLCDFKIDDESGFVSIRISNSTKHIVNGLFDYTLQNRASFNWEMAYENLSMILNAKAELTDLLNSEVEMSGSSLPNVYFGILIGLSSLPHGGYIKYRRDQKSVVLEYDLQEFNRNVFILTANLASELYGYKNGSVMFHGTRTGNRNHMLINGTYGGENATAEIVYSLISTSLKSKYISKFMANLNFNYSDKVNLFSEIENNIISDKNSSNVDATFKSNIPHLKFINVLISNVNSQNNYKLDVKLNHESNIYTIFHSFEHPHKSVVILTLITTPFFGNVSANINYHNNKAKMKAIYSTLTKNYTISAQSEFKAFRGTSVFSVTTPTNKYVGSFELDLTGKNKYVYLTVSFPNKISNILEIRLGENLWPNLVTRLRIIFPSFLIPTYTLDINYSYLTQTGALLLEYVKNEHRYKVDMRKSGNNFMLMVDIPKKVNYILIHGSNTGNYMIHFGENRVELALKHEMQLNMKAFVAGFGNVAADVALDNILNATVTLDSTRFLKLILDRNALLSNKNMLDLSTNEGSLFTIWTGSTHSYLFAKYKSDSYNLSLLHDVNNQVGVTFNKNGYGQIIILTTWSLKEENSNIKGTIIFSHSALKKLNITAQFRKTGEKYAADINISNALRNIFKSTAYFEILAYNAYLKIMTPSEFLQSLEYFVYADTDKMNIKTKLSVERYYNRNEYYGHINLSDLQNLSLDLKYPCPLEDCKFYLKYKANYFEVILKGPGMNLHNFSIVATLSKNDFERGMLLQFRNNANFLLLHYNLTFSAQQVTFVGQSENNVLPMYTQMKINCFYEYYKNLMLLLNFDNMENKLDVRFDNNILDLTISAFYSLINIKSSVAFVWEDNLKTLKADLFDYESNNRYLLQMRLDQNPKNVSGILYTSSKYFNFDARGCVTPSRKQLFIKYENTVLLDIETIMERSARNEEFMFVNVHFDRNICRFNVSYNHETRMFNLAEFELKNWKNLKIIGYGEFSISKGNLRANLNSNKNLSLVWIISQNNSYEVEFTSNNETFGLLVEIARPPQLTIKMNTPNNNSTLKLNYIPSQNGTVFTGDFELFLNPRLYYIRNELKYNFKSIKRNIVYNEGFFNFLLHSNFIVSPLSADLEYSISSLDFNRMEGLKINTNCSGCQPSQVLVTITSPFSDFKFLHLTAKLNPDLKHVNITFEKNKIKSDAQLFINANGNTYNLQIKSKTDNKTLGNAIILLQSSQYKLKGTANLNFPNLPFTTSLNFEPNKFKFMLNSPFQRLRNLKVSGNYDLYGVLNTESINKASFISQIEIGEKMKGIFNIQKTNSHFELFGYFPDKTASFYGNFSKRNCKVVIKSPFEKVKEINFDGKYNESSVEMSLTGNALRENFVLSVNASIKNSSNFALNSNCDITNKKLKWKLSAIFDLYKHSELKLIGDRLNTTAAYTLNKVRSGIVFDSYLNTINQNNTFGFIWNAEPHYEFYLNENKVFQKILVQNGLIETVIFSQIPFFNITQAGFILTRNIFNNAIRNKIFYNEYYIDAEHRNVFNIKLKYYLPIIQIQSFLHVETIYTDNKLTLKYCNCQESCVKWHSKYENNATHFNFEISQEQQSLQKPTPIYVLQFTKTLDQIKLHISNVFHLDLEYVNFYTAKLQFIYYYRTQHELVLSFMKNEVYLRISTPFMQLCPLTAKFDVKKTNSNFLLQLHVNVSESELVKFFYGFERFPNVFVVEMGVSADNKTIYSSIVKVVQTEITEVFANGYIFNQNSKMYVVFNKNNPYVFGITISNPLLPDGGYTFEALFSKTNKVFVFLGSGYSDLLQNGLINTDSHNIYFTLYGFYVNQTLNVKADLRGFDYFKEIEVGFKLWRNSEINANIIIFSEMFGNSSARFTYIANNTNLNVDGHIHMPHFDRFGFILQLPIAVSAGYNPKLVLNAFDKNYAIEATYKNLEKRKIVLKLGYEFVNLKFDGILEIALLPKLSLFLNAKTKNNYLEAVYNKNTSSEISVNYLTLNNKHYEFNHAIVFQTNRKLVDISFFMPHGNYSNYSLTFEIKNAENKLLKFYIVYPTFGQKQIGFEMGFSPITLTSFELLTQISLPTYIENFTDGKLLIKHNFQQQKNSKIYFFQCEANTNKHMLLMEINAADIINLKKFSTNVEVDNHIFQVKLESSGSDIRELQAEFALMTPIKSIEQLSLYLNNTKTEVTTYSCGFNYNFKEVLKAVYHGDNYTHVAEVVTPWKSLGGEYKYLNQNNEFQLKGLVYWERNASIGGHVYMGDNFAIGVILPGRVWGIESNYISNNTDEFLFGRIYWNANDSAALRIVFKNITTLKFAELQYHISLNTPFTTMEYSYNLEMNFSKGARSLVFIRWDKHPSSQLTLDTYLSNKNLQSRLTSPLLSHDIALNISSLVLSNSLSKLHVDLVYSEIQEKHLIFETTYQKTYTNIFATQRKILIKHPASKIDYLLILGTFRTEEFTNGSFAIHYRNFITNVPEQINAFINIAHKKLSVLGQIKTHKNDLTLKMKSSTEEDLNNFAVSFQMNDKDPLILTVQYKFQLSALAITTTVSYGNGRSFKLFLGLPTRKEVIASLVHETYHYEVVDSLLTAKLNSSQLLWIKLQWKRDIINRFYKVILAEYADLKFVMEAIGRELIEVIDDDFGNQLISDVSYMRVNLCQYAEKEVNEFKEHYKQFLDNIKEGVRHNSFYSRDIIELLKVFGKNFQFILNVVYPIIDTFKFGYDTAVYIINDAFVCIQYVGSVIQQHVENITEDLKDVRKLKECAKNVLKAGIEDTQKSLREMQKLAVQTLNLLEDYIAEIKDKIEKFFEPCLNVLDDSIVYIEQRLAVMQLLLLDILDTIQSYVANLQEMQDLIKTYSIYFSWLEEFHLIDLLEPVGNAIECVLEEIVDDLKRVYDDYRPYIDALYNTMFGKYEQLIQLPPLSEVRKLCNKIYQKTVWFWKYNNLSEAMKNYIREVFTNIDDFLMILLELENLSGEDFETILQNADYIYRPEEGYIECNLPLAVEWESFDTLPKFEQHSLYQKIQMKLDYLKQIEGNFIEVINSFTRFTLLMEMSPNVNNYAIIIEGKHFITFDGYYYNLAGECSYLLAGDFKTNAFSLTINYEKGHMKSLGVNIYNDTIELARAFEVSLNGKTVDLPIFLNSTSVTRNYQTITVKNTKGLELTCDYYYNICTIKLSRWLFGKTGGLLGTLDNEKITDLIFPNGTKTSDISKFVESWSINSNKCQFIATNINLPPLEEEDLTEALCNSLFVNRNSPLSDCFHRVNSSPFLNICLNDIKSNGSVCSAIVAYTRMCSNFDIHIKIPEMCVNCPVDGTEIGANEEIFDGRNPKAVDVVFIYDDNCLDGFISNLSLNIEETLIQQGYYSKRYAYVGYGASEPYIMTQEQLVWSDASERVLMQKRERTSGSSSAIDAIIFALQLDFRPRVSKIFVLLQCHACPYVNNIPNIYNMLGEKDVTLHVITLQPEFASDYSALDANGNVLYQTVINNSTRINNSLIMEEISDSCSLLALGTNGTVANFNDFLKSTSMRHKWTQFGLQTIKTSPCQKCKCIPDEHGIGKVECIRCMAPRVKYLLNEYESNIIKL